MSRQNKVNKTNYVQRGRLTPDEMARERVGQAQFSGPSTRAKSKENVSGKMRGRPGGRGSSRPGTRRGERG